MRSGMSASVARQRFVWRNGKCIDVTSGDPQPSPRGTILISDSLDYVRHPATGRRYTSKSRYYADTKALGYQILGNEKPKPKPKIQPHPEPVGRALYRNWDKLGGGR